MRIGLRVIVAILLVGALLGLCVHYGATYDENWPHPTGDQLATDYDTYVDERVLLIGEVISTNPSDETVTIEITDDADETAAEIQVHGVTQSVAVGGTVQAYGTLHADRTLTPTTIVVVNHSSWDGQYKLGTSAVGILLAITYFLIHWQPDFRRFVFRQRTPDRRNLD
mgnify:CR=1 FL=1